MSHHFKSLYVIPIYFLFCICLIGYNAEGQGQPPSSQTAEAYLSSGLEKMNRGDFEEAIPDFDQTLEIDSQLANAYLHRGIAKIELRRYEEAMEDFNKAANMFPNTHNSEAYLYSGLVRIELNQNEEAIEDFSKAIETIEKYKKEMRENMHSIQHKIDPQFASKAYHYRGVAKTNLGNYEEAILDFNKAIEIDPQLAEAYFHRGIAKAGLGKKDNKVLKDHKTALRIDPLRARDHHSYTLPQIIRLNNNLNCQNSLM